MTVVESSKHARRHGLLYNRPGYIVDDDLDYFCYELKQYCRSKKRRTLAFLEQH